MFVTKKKYKAMMEQKEDEKDKLMEDMINTLSELPRVLEESEDRVTQEMILNFKHQFNWGIESQKIADLVDKEIAKELEDGKEFE